MKMMSRNDAPEFVRSRITNDYYADPQMWTRFFFLAMFRFWSLDI